MGETLKKINSKYWIIAIFIILILVGFKTKYLSIVSTGRAELLWNNLFTVITSSTDFKNYATSCNSDVGTYSSTIDDTNGSINLRSRAIIGSCHSGGSSGTIDVKIPYDKIKNSKNIFLTLDGFTTTGGITCESASLNGQISQEAGNTQNLFMSNAKEGIPNGINPPQGILFTIDGDFISIPSASSTFQMKGSGDFHLAFSSSATSSCNNRNSRAELNLNSIQFTDLCTLEQGQLCNPSSKSIVSFSNGCEKQNLLNQGYSVDLPLCCVPSWSCTEWSTCNNGQQTRTCTDTACDQKVNKPSEEEACMGQSDDKYNIYGFIGLIIIGLVFGYYWHKGRQKS